MKTSKQSPLPAAPASAIELLPKLKASYIEALGPALTTAELTKRLSHVPTVTGADRSCNGTDRIIRGEQIQDEIVVAHPASMDLYHSTRSAQVRRYNTVVGTDARLLRQLHGSEEGVSFPSSGSLLNRSAASIALVGPTGMGKTTLLNAVAHLSPQCVRHDNLMPGTEVVQVLMVYVALTGDATVKNLFLRIVEAIDRALGSTLYTDRILRGRMSTEQLKILVLQLCVRFGVGLIYIDEMQNMTSSRAGGPELVTNELLYLRDVLGIPLVFSGTYAMMKMISNDARLMRRVSQNGLYPMAYATSAKDPYWKTLCKVRWQSMVLRQNQPMSDEILDTLFEYTQGMTWALTALLCKAQRRAINSGKEAVTVEMLRNTFAHDATEMHGLVHAVASGDETVLTSYEHLYHPLFDQKKAQKRSEEFERLRGISRTQGDAEPKVETIPDSKIKTASTTSRKKAA
jgi:energy-coupling factor transporter ATP-binding protein EcfA2